MAEIRKIPFGYAMENGEICVSPEESTTVKKIYDLYILGESYQKIAERLNEQPVQYVSGKLWNKNMVKRILADSRYLGGKYPQIISSELYMSAVSLADKKVNNDMKIDDITYFLSRICYCGECGKQIQRNKRTYTWGCDCNTAKVKEENISIRTLNIVEKIIANPDLLQKEPTPKLSPEFILLDNLTEAESIKEIMKITAEQYRKIGNSGYETERLKRKFTNMENQQITVEILKDIISKVLIQTDSKIAIQLKNKQIFKEETG